MNASLVCFLGLFLCCLTSPQTRASEAMDGWSEKFNGLRARLSLEPDPKSPFVKVFIELQNTSDVAGSRKIRFDPKTIEFHVADALGNPLAKANGAYDGISPIWEPLLLPMEGTIHFRISFPGLGYRPVADRRIIDLGPSISWVVPEDKECFISGTLTIPKVAGDHPHSDWSGTLTLPAIKIPKTNKGKPDGAANGTQPIRSGTNPVSSAAGSRD